MDSIVTTVFEGRQIENNLSQKLNELLERGAAKIKASNSEHNVFQRIQTAKQAFDKDSVYDLIAPYKKYFGKDSKLSIGLREKGNELYKKKNLDGALRAYTLSLAFAPIIGNACDLNEEMLLAYTNRSAVLLHKNCASEAIADIQRALNILSSTGEYKGQIPNLKEKLEERKDKCEQLVKSNTLGSNKSELKTKEEEELITLLKNKLFKVETPSKTIPNAESFVEIKYSQERGRHLIVTRDVKAGSVLLVDQPSVSVLNNVLRWETEHCHYCNRGIVNGLPCLECTFALFCNEDCRDIACSTADGPTQRGGIHHLEHKYLPILHLLDTTHGDIQSLRLLAKFSKEELLEVSNSLKNSSLNGTLLGFDKNGIYDVNSYLPIFHLISHPPLKSSFGGGGENEIDEASKNAMKALFLKEVLRLHTKYIGSDKAKGKKAKSPKNFEDLVASIILKHLESIKYNAISLSKLVNNKTSGATKSAISYAAAVYPLISLCNHSCDPNCAPVKQSKHLVTSLVALKHLKEGDELFITYKPLYTQMKTSERQKFLAEGYRFICNCQACEGNWSPGMLIQNQGQQGAMLILQPSRCEKCPEIFGDLDDKQKKLKQCHECALKDLGRAKSIQEMEKILFECHDLLITGKEKENENVGICNVAECLKRLPEVVDYFGRESFQSYFPLYNVALDLFKRALVQSVSQM